jgi:3-hydroxy-9,10-secoandrosta-1,3,5(10)-triene-9,17-dione monooxygenase reductase component
MGNVEQLDRAGPRFVRGGDLRAAMGHFATGVAVVTASDAGGRPFGTTANAISSLSLDPPLVLACLRRESETLAALRDTSRFAVNVLGAGQRALSDRFARRTTPDTWDGVAHRLPDGVPVLDDALATVECDVHEIAGGGDHVIVIGRVRAVGHPDDHVEPLLFYRGGYAALGDEALEEDVAPAEDDAAAAEALEVALPSALGALRMIALDDGGTVEASVAVLVGEPRDSSGALLYLHRGCLLGDALGSEACGGRKRLHAALRDIAASGLPGVIVYHRDSAAGFGACCLDAPGAVAPPVTESERRAVRQAVARLGLQAPVVLDEVAA